MTNFNLVGMKVGLLSQGSFINDVMWFSRFLRKILLGFKILSFFDSVHVTTFKLIYIQKNITVKSLPQVTCPPLDPISKFFFVYLISFELNFELCRAVFICRLERSSGEGGVFTV